MNNNKKCPVFNFYAASRKLIKIYTGQLKPLGLTYPQYLVISCLIHKDNLSVDDIGQELELDSGTLTPLLKRLEASGIIIREHSREDERKRIIKLTPQGKTFSQSFKSLRHKIREELKISDIEVDQLNQTLSKILS